MYISNFFKHIGLVIRHKHKVFVHCAKCGIPLRGIVHDLSKYSPTEFFESVRYFQGNRSPITACRKDKGVSLAWLHHKGRNKHHIEYWQDDECGEHPMMPYKYAVECVCDKLAATKTYNGKNYTPDKCLAHWKRVGDKVKGNPRTLAFMERVFTDINDHGEGYVLNKRYMKRTYAEICLGTDPSTNEN